MTATARRLMSRLALALAAVTTTACSSDGFTIQGQIDGVPERLVTVAYMGDHGMVAEQVPLQKGNTLTYEGRSQQHTLLFIWDAQGQLIAQMVVCDGDRMTVNSDGLQLPTPQVSGNEPTQQWMKFRRDNLNAFNAGDKQTIAQLIAQHINRHPDQLLSTVLLVAEYAPLTDTATVAALLSRISPEARPQRLVQTLETMLQRNPPVATARLTAPTLWLMDSGLQTLDTDDKAALLLLWRKGDHDLQACIDTLRAIRQDHNTPLYMADILLDADTTGWYAATRADATLWQHWWAPGGMMEANLLGLDLQRTPVFVQLDTTSRVIHQGATPKLPAR